MIQEKSIGFDCDSIQNSPFGLGRREGLSISKLWERVTRLTKMGQKPRFMTENVDPKI